MIRCKKLGSEALVFSLSRWERKYTRWGAVLVLAAWPFGYAWFVWHTIQHSPVFEVWPWRVICLAVVLLVMFVFIARYLIRDLKNADATISVTRERVTRALPSGESRCFRWSDLPKIRFDSYGPVLYFDRDESLRLGFHHHRGLSRRAFRRMVEWAELDLDGVQVQGFLGWRPWRGK